MLCHDKKQVTLAKQFIKYLKSLVYTDESNEVRIIMMMHEVGSILGSASFMLDQLEDVDVEVCFSALSSCLYLLLLHVPRYFCFRYTSSMLFSNLFLTLTFSPFTPSSALILPFHFLYLLSADYMLDFCSTIHHSSESPLQSSFHRLLLLLLQHNNRTRVTTR